MYTDRKLVLGFAPTRRKMFPGKELARENKTRILKKVKTLLKGTDVELVDIDWLNEEGLLTDIADVGKVEDRFRQAKVDALFMPHCNFGSEEVVGKLGKVMGKPFLLWGERDETPPQDKGMRQTDTQCGLFASSKALQRYGAPFTYIENCRLNDRSFEAGFMDFLRTASVVKKFNNLRIGQVSLRPKPFLSVIVNESELLEKFGIEIVPVTAVELTSRTDKILESRMDEVRERIADIKSKMNCSAMKEEQMEKIAALEFAFAEFADEHQCDAMASECWINIGKTYGVRPCFMFGDLIDRGLIAACETDINGAVTMAILKAAALGQGLPFLADLTIRHPENDNAELLWHCGPFPQSLARYPEKRELKGSTGVWELKGGEITVARFDGCRGKYNLFAGLGRGVEGPATNGNYVWVEVDDWVKWEKKFIYGPYIHHVACIHGNYVPIMEEACKYVGDVEIDLP